MAREIVKERNSRVEWIANSRCEANARDNYAMEVLISRGANRAKSYVPVIIGIRGLTAAAANAVDKFLAAIPAGMVIDTVDVKYTPESGYPNTTYSGEMDMRAALITAFYRQAKKITINFV
jgi:hypothetical protein